jgi:NADH-quinone oxidoreductase subunit M
VILSACYLLWAFQRVFYGEVTHQKNKELHDVDAREHWGLIVFAVVILWMGIGSPYFTRRIAAPVETVIQQTQSHYAEEAARPAAQPASTLTTEAKQDSVRRVVSR